MKDIPVLFAKGKSLAQAYENALVELYKNGGRMSTQYDKAGDPQSVDATMNITIESPLSDPMIHKAFPGGPADLREYVYELDGLKNSWVKYLDDEKDTRWEYTYNQRLTGYGELKLKEDSTRNQLGKYNLNKTINQIELIVDKLVKQPFTRQAQAVTWIPAIDNFCYDPACLQSLLCRINEDSDGKRYLNTNIRFRSNDAWNAFFLNVFGFTMFIKNNILDEIVKRSGKELLMGRINWQADSWHIYGKDIKQAKERLFDRLETTSFEDRIYNFYDPDIQEMYHECEADILKKIEDKNKEYASKNN
jgi:thymidylate synthase